MSKASTLTIRIPTDLKHRIALVADEQGGLNQPTCDVYVCKRNREFRSRSKDFSILERLLERRHLVRF